jgi:hypothetical protein
VVFDTPNYCVKEVAYASLYGNSEQELFDQLLAQNEALIVNDDLRIISGAP